MMFGAGMFPGLAGWMNAAVTASLYVLAFINLFIPVLGE